jgi:hypothetical protein
LSQDNQITRDEVGGTYVTQEGDKNAYKVLGENVKEIDHLEDLEVDRRVKLKSILRNTV